MFYIEHQIANTLEKSFLLYRTFIQTILIILKLNPFGFVYLYFMNFWQITSSYILLNINTPRYLKKILQKIHDFSDKPVLSLFGDNLPINSKM